jgi:hypothetical protein
LVASVDEEYRPRADPALTWSQHWRFRAEETRTVADQINSPWSKPASEALILAINLSGRLAKDLFVAPMICSLKPRRPIATDVSTSSTIGVYYPLRRQELQCFIDYDDAFRRVQAISTSANAPEEERQLASELLVAFQQARDQ